MTYQRRPSRFTEIVFTIPLNGPMLVDLDMPDAPQVDAGRGLVR